MLVLWTDGSANPNPGPGGFAVLSDKGAPVALGSAEETTNIRMEASALIAAMEYAAGVPCEIHTDSEFWINVLTRWAPVWEANDWQKKSGEAIKNLDLVKSAYSLYEQGNVRLIFTYGHVGTALNEAADKWAKRARKGAKL